MSGGTPSTFDDANWNGNIPWIKSAKLTQRYITQGERMISQKGLDNSASNIVQRNNILIATRVSLGNVSINKLDIAINQDITGIIVTDRTPDSYWTKLHLETLGSAEVHLKAYLADLQQSSKEETVEENTQTPLKTLEFLFKKFHVVAKGLTKRHDSRTTLRINDEYDIQDLLRSLMMLYFDDIRIEQWTPGYASKSVKMDFLLNREQIVVECKMTRFNHNERKISDELIVDIARYVKDARCKKLVCLIYDPGDFIENKSVLSDLEDKSNSAFSVHIYVVP